MSHLLPNRRAFLTGAAALTGLAFLPSPTAAADTPAKPASDLNVLGPKPGYSPQLGTLVSMFNWMTPAVTGPVQKLTVADLDYLFDAKANSIGALLLHLSAAEALYQRITFDNLSLRQIYKPGGDFDKQWGAAMELGDRGRKEIKGREVDYYIARLNEVRGATLAGFKQRDDAWLMAVDQGWPWGPTDNYCKWFHVCEHMSHHAGQIDLLLKRLPSYKPTKESGV